MSAPSCEAVNYRAAVFVGADGKVYVCRPLERDILAFARIWDRNIKHQASWTRPRPRPAVETIMQPSERTRLRAVKSHL